VVRAALVLRTLTRPVSLVLAYALIGCNKKRAKNPVTARKIYARRNMCVKYINPDDLGYKGRGVGEAEIVTRR